MECSYAVNYERYEYIKYLNIHIFQIGCYMYKAMNDLLPTHLIILSKTMYFTTIIPGRVAICMLSHIAHKLGLIVYVLEVLLFGTLLK